MAGELRERIETWIDFPFSLRVDNELLQSFLYVLNNCEK